MQDFNSWSSGKVCGALKALFDAKCFWPRTRDNIIMYDIGRHLSKYGTLMPRQIDVVRSKLPKYASALSKLTISDIDLNLPDGSPKYSFTMHNPKTLRIYAPARSPILTNISRIDGFRIHSDGYFLIPFSARNAYVLLHNGFIMGPRVADFLAMPIGRLPQVEFGRLKIRPKQYQQQGIRLLLARHGRALLADEQGLGKTGQAIGWAELAGIKKLCIVCPASLKVNWQREIEKWIGDKDSCLLSGRYNAGMSVCGDLQTCRWVIINYDILTAWLPALTSVPFEAVIFDEGQALKNMQAKRTKSAMSLAKKVRHILILSGTPCENRPVEFFPLIQMIDPLLFPSRMKYLERYCDLKINKAGYPDYSGASNTKELHKILVDTIMIRRKKADVLTELPEKQRAVVSLPLSATDLRNYQAIEQDFISWLRAANQGISEKKLARKIAAQAVIKVGVLKRLAAKLKLSLVIDWIRTYLENENKLVVFAEQHEIIDNLKQEFGSRAVVVDGRVSAEKRQAICDAFQNDERINLFIGNLRAAGTGLTLTAAKDTVTIELGWTSTLHDQCEDRVHRIGQKNAVMAYYLVAVGTVEERVLSMLDRKRTIISQVMDDGETVDVDLLDELLKQYMEQ